MAIVKANEKKKSVEIKYITIVAHMHVHNHHYDANSIFYRKKHKREMKKKSIYAWFTLRRKILRINFILAIFNAKYMN